MRSCRQVHFRLLERFQESIDRALCAWIALCDDFFPEAGAVALPVLPAFLPVRSVGVKIALPFAPGPGIRGDSSLGPVPHRAFADAELTGNVLDRMPLLLQEHGLLIPCLSLSATDGNGSRHLFPWVWTPFFHSDRPL